MKEFLEELEELLERYNVAIVRSANSTHDLVISLVGEETEELTFKEEITNESIKYGR